MSNAIMVIVGFPVLVPRAGLGQAVYAKANRLTLSEPIGRYVNLRDSQRKALYGPRLSLDNLGHHPYTGGKE
jgi:hypothetical protein